MVSLKQIVEPEETALSTQLVEAKCEQVCGKFLYWEKVVVIIIVPFTQLDSSDSVNYVIKEMTYLKLRDILRMKLGKLLFRSNSCNLYFIFLLYRRRKFVTLKLHWKK